MRLLADENIPLDTVRALRAAGHDVYSATESAPGAADLDHLRRAVTEDRLVLTFDTDFGELLVRGSDPPKAGVILLRLVPTSATDITTLLLDLLSGSDITWQGHLTVVDDRHIRQRPL
jgi:predicted nuclease of predicted toxin-antitoxin system